MPAPRAKLGAVLALGVVALFVASVFSTLAFGISTCDSEGGAGFSAGSSTAGRFCDSGGFSAWLAATALLPTAVLVVLGLLAMLAQRWARLVVAGLVAVGVLISLVMVVVVLPDTCGAGDQAAYDAWVQGGRQGSPPAECATS